MSDANPYQSPATSNQDWEDKSGANSVPDEAVESLMQTKPWVRFISVLGFIASVGVLAVVVVTTVAARGVGPVEMVVMIPMFILFYFVPSLLLWKYANRIGDFQQTRTVRDFSGAITAQKSFWKYVGILMLVILCFYAVILAIGVIVALVSVSR